MRSEPLRNEAIALELERAIERKAYGQLLALLCRFSGLPGPRPNIKLAASFGQTVAARGHAADALIAELTSGSRERVPQRGTPEFLPIVGAFCLAARLISKGDPGADLDALRELAEDPRHLVREGATAALAEIGRERGVDLVARLAAWMDGYLSAAVALDAITARVWLDAAKAPDDTLARFDDAFALAEGAQRSDQRSQGYRTLISTLPRAMTNLLGRFPDRAASWLEEKASTDHVELREALGSLAERARAKGRGAGGLERFGQLLDASAPPRRDPRTYVGPTRKRGSRKR